MSREKFPTRKETKRRKNSGQIIIKDGTKVLVCTNKDIIQLQDLPEGSDVYFFQDVEVEVEIIPENRKCDHCGGEGWLWSHELKHYYGDDDGGIDDTRYTCDYCDGEGIKQKEE